MFNIRQLLRDKRYEEAMCQYMASSVDAKRVGIADAIVCDVLPVLVYFLDNFGDSKEELPFLHTACEWKRHTMITLLLDKYRSDVNKVYKGDTALAFACIVGDPVGVKILLDHGADTEVRDNDGRTAVYRALRDSECLKLLLQAKAKVNVQDKDGLTPLHVACLFYDGHSLSNIANLLRHGANRHIKDNSGWTPAMLTLARLDVLALVTLYNSEPGVDFRKQD